MKFYSSIKKANTKGTGFLFLPKDKRSSFQLGNRVEVKLFNAVMFFAEIVEWSGWGIYVPKKIMLENNLLGREVETQIRKISGFYSKLDKDGRIYIPEDIVARHNLQENDVVLVKGLKGGEVVKEKYCRICLTRRPKRERKEYGCTFDKEFYGEKLEFRTEKKDNEKLKSQLSSATAAIVENMDYTFIDKNSLIIFEGNKVPTTIPTKVNLNEIAFYLGAYFADGTKKGNTWAISASTFRQGRYYLKTHNLLIKDSDPEFVVSYTKLPKTSFKKAKKELANRWENEVGVKIDRFRIRNPKGKVPVKRNKNGTLVIREAKQILFDVYKGLLNLLIEEIITSQNKKLSIDFICGVLEGDGSVPARKRGHIGIYTNKKEAAVLDKILEVSRVKYKKRREGENKYALRIGVLEILRNFHRIKKKVFSLYPKRRKALFTRLPRSGVVKFLIGNHEPCSWVKTWLKDNSFVDKNYKLTGKGIKLSNALMEEIGKI